MIIYQLLILVYSVILHEIAHGFIADKLGDPTARISGRLTLNPIPHIDPLLTIGLPLILVLSGSPVILGGAKPVPVDPYNFRNQKRDIALTSIAGPLTNFIIALISALVLQFINSNLLIYSIIINIFLGIFNLLPIPPLDGFKVVGGFLPNSISKKWFSLERYGFLFIIIFLLFLNVIMINILYPIANYLINFFT